MPKFELPKDLKFNRGIIENPKKYFDESGTKSWLFLIGEEFASMPGGMSYDQVKSATPNSKQVISDPPRVMTVELARQQIKALDELPRPTLMTCRTGPRSSALAYLYAGLKHGADPNDVIAAAEKDDAPFIKQEELKEWIKTSMETLKSGL